jgi:hypothetical protein
LLRYMKSVKRDRLDECISILQTVDDALRRHSLRLRKGDSR